MSIVPQTQRPQALIVEDDIAQASIFEQALQMADFETQIITDGQAALDALQTVTPALVVLDLHLPTVSGAEILHAIRAEPRLAGARVMLATANPLAAESLRGSSDLVLLKPISFSQLRDLAHRLHP